MVKKIKKKVDTSIKKNLNNRVLTIPNILTLIRIILVPVIFVLVMKNEYSLGIGLAMFAALTDLMDGYIARKYDMGSSIGKTLDPLADKIIIFSLIILAILKFNFPIWLSIIIVSRDIMILLGGLAIIILNKEYRLLLSPNIYGKLSTFMQFTTIIVYLFAKSSGLYDDHALGILILLYLTCAITLFSGIMYIFQGYKIFKNHRLSKKKNLKSKSNSIKFSNSKSNYSMIKKLNFANIVTIIRILLIIPFIVLLNFSLNPTFIIYREYAAWFFIILCLTDFLDGFIARRYNQKTVIGAMLDPLADKLLILITLVFLIGQGVKAWMVVVVFARELLITGLRSIADSSGKSIPAKFSGKIKTVSQMIAIVFVILELPFYHQAILIATLITLYSGLEYIWIERHLLKEMFKR